MSEPPRTRRARRATSIAELEGFSRRLNSSLQLDTVCEVLADGVEALLGGNRCAVFLLDRRTEVVNCVLARGLTADYTAAVATMYRQLPGGQLLNQRFLIVKDARTDEQMAPLRRFLEHNGFVSMLLVALRHQDVTLGAVAVYYDTVQHFDESLLALAQTLSNQAAIALDNAQTHQRAQQRMVELEKLRHAAIDINGQPDLQSTLNMIVRWAADLLDVQGAYIYLYDAEREELEVRAVYEAPKSHVGRRMKVGDGLSGRVFLARQPQAVGDYRSWTMASSVWSDVTFGTVLAVPLIYSDNPIGVLNFVDDARNRMPDEDAMRVAGLFASQAVSALASALSLAEIHRRADRLMSLQRVAASVTAALDLRAVLQSVVEDLRNTFGYALTSIHRLQGDVLVLEAVAGLDVEVPEVITRREQGIIGRAARTATPQYVTDVSRDYDFVSVLPGTLTEAAVPVLLDGEVWGVLNVEATDRSALSAADVPLLGMFCQQIAVAIRNAGNFAEIQQRVAEMEGLRRTSLVLASSLDPEDLLKAIALSVRDLANPNSMHLYLCDQDTNEFRLGAIWPETDRRPDVDAFRADGVAARAIEERRPVIIDDALNHPPFGLNPDPTMHARNVASIAAFPMLRPSGVMGVVTLSYTQPTQISGALERILALFADQAAIALENARLYQLEARRRELADTLRQLASAVNSMMGFEQAATTILEYMARVVALDSTSILVMEGEQFRIAAHLARTGVAWTDSRVFPRGQLLSSERVFDSNEPMMIPDTSKSAIWRHDVGRVGVGSWLGFPITFQGEPFGVLCIDRDQPGSFSLAEIQIVKAFADQAATGLANARLFQAAAERAQENERLKEFNESLVRSVETGILLEGIDDSIQYVNPRLCEMVGYAEGELIGQPSAMLLSPEMSKLVDRKATRRRFGEKGRYEAALLRKDGSEVPVLVNATPRLEHGVFTGTLTAFIDITQRKRTEKTLLALNAAAAAVRQVTEPQQVYQTISQEVSKLGFSSISFSFDAATQLLRVEHYSLVGQLQQAWSVLDSSDADTINSISLKDLPDFERPLETGQAEFFPAPSEAASLSVLEQVSIPRKAIGLALTRQCGVLAPFVSQHRVTGVFVVLGENLSEDDLPAFEAFANQASAALDNARLLAAERRERQRAETLGKVASILNTTSDLDDALRQVMQQLRSILRFDNSALFLVRDEAIVCHLAEGIDADWWLGRRLSLEGYPLLQEMATNRTSILVRDTRTEPRWIGSPHTLHLASWIGAPLLAEGRLIGMLSVDKAQHGFYTAENLEVMTVIANQLSVAVQRVRHFNEAQQRLRELASLAQVSALLTEAPDLTAVLHVVLSNACEVLGSNRGAIALTDELGDRLRVMTARGHAPGYIERVNSADLRLPAGLARGPSLRPQILADPDELNQQPDTPVTGVALTLGKQLIGLIEVEQSSLDAPQCRLLTAVADLAAVAIDKAQLYQDTVRAYEELRDLDRLKDEFVQNVSHELRTPLTFVKGYVEYLLEGYAGELNANQRQALEIVLDRSDAIIRLVNDIVSLKQTELQEMDLHALSLEPIANACVEGSRIAAEQAGIRMKVDIPANLPKVQGDGKRLGQVFDNLLGNAIKFSPNGGLITVRLAHIGNVVQVEVRDMGIGIPSDRLDQIWQRFYQIDSASTRRFPGAGLGLAIVKRIIDAHDGRIWVESDVDKGSAFYFILPVCGDDNEAQATA
jgi:PAS domain S-box-containing protein